MQRTEALSFAVVALLAYGSLAAEPVGNPAIRKREGYEKVRTLGEAVELARKALREDGKPAYAVLVTENRMREAIRTAIKGYEQKLARDAKDTLGRDHWFLNVKPALVKIADTGEWPGGCYFDGFYGLTESSGLTYDGLGLRLHVDTPGKRFAGFALPVVDLFFGKWA